MRDVVEAGMAHITLLLTLLLKYAWETWWGFLISEICLGMWLGLGWPQFSKKWYDHSPAATLAYSQKIMTQTKYKCSQQYSGH